MASLITTLVSRQTVPGLGALVPRRTEAPACPSAGTPRQGSGLSASSPALHSRGARVRETPFHGLLAV